MTNPPRLTVYRSRLDGQPVTVRGDACPMCGRPDLEPHEIPGDGRIVVWTTIHIPPARYADEAPYTVAMVELEGGVRIMGRLIGEAGRELGARVRLQCVDPERGPIFEPVNPP
ncbi:MAG: OB-fold domain-containing protein [Chloroflexota bacterium]|nr:OB-fold domain-containing protein [Chloroflexota bacterium]